MSTNRSATMSEPLARQSTSRQWREPHRARAAHEAPARRAARRPASDRNQGRMRRRRVRFLLGAHERRAGEQLPGARAAGRRRGAFKPSKAWRSTANLHPLQEAFLEHGGAQCGICTPGMLMAAAQLLDHNPHPERGRDSRRPCRQSLPLHGIHAHLRVGRGRRGRRTAATNTRTEQARHAR